MKRIKLGKYKHYKGREYRVIGVARHSETLEELVVNQGLYKHDKYGEGAIWVRPLEMFLGEVKVNGKKVLRFEYIGN